VRVLVIDNYDSFTFNLVQYLGELGAECDVHRNDAITVDTILKNRVWDRVLLSPGPCTPNEAGVCLELITRTANEKTPMPILGVCLGHQSIGQAFGGSIVRAPKLMHGKTSAITHGGEGVFRDLPNPMIATRYHSLVIDPPTLPAVLRRTAWTDDGATQPTIMGVKHATLPIEGVQFHPESILTVDGKRLLANWLVS
jgi:anthranilate synthase component 2